ncbi:hypothetical protein ABKN59_001567 [Abortiporus biennis]
MSSQDAPLLSLDDIMHTHSPSPAPQPPPQLHESSVDPQATMSSRTPAVGASESLSFAQTALSSGPVPSETRAEPSSLPDQDIDIEPLTVSDLQQMRGRLEQLGLIGSDESKQSTLSSIEKELVDMVLKLTVRPVVDTSQLLSQAEVIAALSQKCANVVEEMSEVRQRWAVERRGWERSSEALIIQRNSAREGIMDEETHKQITRLMDDNKHLRSRLSEAQARFHQLENEFVHVRRLLILGTIDSPNYTYTFPSLAIKSQQQQVNTYQYPQSIPPPSLGPSIAAANRMRKAMSSVILPPPPAPGTKVDIPNPALLGPSTNGTTNAGVNGSGSGQKPEANNSTQGTSAQNSSTSQAPAQPQSSTASTSTAMTMPLTAQLYPPPPGSTPTVPFSQPQFPGYQSILPMPSNFLTHSVPPPTAAHYRGPREREMDLAQPVIRKSRKGKATLPPNSNTAAGSAVGTGHANGFGGPLSSFRHSAAIFADAKSECILAASKKWGNVRAGVVSGYLKEKEKEKEKEKNEGEESAAAVNGDVSAQAGTLTGVTKDSGQDGAEPATSTVDVDMSNAGPSGDVGPTSTESTSTDNANNNATGQNATTTMTIAQPQPMQTLVVPMALSPQPHATSSNSNTPSNAIGNHPSPASSRQSARGGSAVVQLVHPPPPHAQAIIPSQISPFSYTPPNLNLYYVPGHGVQNFAWLPFGTSYIQQGQPGVTGTSVQGVQAVVPIPVPPPPPRDGDSGSSQSIQRHQHVMPMIYSYPQPHPPPRIRPAAPIPGPSTQPQASTSNPALDSLLTAARTMIEDEDYDAVEVDEEDEEEVDQLNESPSSDFDLRRSSRSIRGRRRRPTEDSNANQSPAKRRRVGGVDSPGRLTRTSSATGTALSIPMPSPQLPQSRGGAAVERVKSNLDLLADEASQERDRERRPSASKSKSPEPEEGTGGRNASTSGARPSTSTNGGGRGGRGGSRGRGRSRGAKAGGGAAPPPTPTASSHRRKSRSRSPSNRPKSRARYHHEPRDSRSHSQGASSSSMIDGLPAPPPPPPPGSVEPVCTHSPAPTDLRSLRKPPSDFRPTLRPVVPDATSSGEEEVDT